MAAQGALLFALLLLVVPWIVILADAALGFNLVVTISMLVVFSVGLLFVAAVSTEG